MKEQKEEGKIFCIFNSTKVEINECIGKAFEIYLKDIMNDPKEVEKTKLQFKMVSKQVIDRDK